MKHIHSKNTELDYNYIAYVLKKENVTADFSLEKVYENYKKN